MHTRTDLRPHRSRIVVAGLAAFAVLAGVLTTTVATADAATIDVIHVAPFGDDGAPGAADAPVRTVARAIKLADDGDIVRIASGRYHESVQVYRKTVHIEAAAGAVVTFDGSTPITAWTAENGRYWAPWTTDFERAGAPFTTPERPQAGWPEQLFVDGAPLVQVTRQRDVVSGTFFYDSGVGRLWIGDDPTNRIVEGSDLSWGIYFNHADGSSLTGVTVQRYATENRHMAAVRAYADDVRIDDVVVAANARIGLSAMGAGIVIDGVTAIDNGHLGLHGHRADGLTVTGSTVHRNNREGFDAFHSAGGFKITESNGLVVERSSFVANSGPGIWTDLDVTDAVIRGNLAAANSRSGIELELSRRLLVVDNTVHDNGESGVWVLESSAAEIWHNSFIGNVRDVWIEDGPRADVLDVTIANNLLGGDAGAGAVGAVLNVDDWTEQRSAAAMGVELFSNRYWLVPGGRTTAISRWANWPSPLSISSSIVDHVSATGQGRGSDVVWSPTDPFGRSDADARQPDGATLAAPLPSDVLSGLGGTVVEGARPAGPVSAPAWPRDARPTIDGDPVELGRIIDHRVGNAGADAGAEQLVGVSDRLDVPTAASSRIGSAAATTEPDPAAYDVVVAVGGRPTGWSSFVDRAEQLLIDAVA